MGRTFSPKISSKALFDIKAQPKDSFHESDAEYNLSRESQSQVDSGDIPFNAQWSKTDGAALAKAFKLGQQDLSGQAHQEKSKEVRRSEPQKTPQPIKTTKLDEEKPVTAQSQRQQPQKPQSEIIPKFYFAERKPVSSEEQSNQEHNINQIFEKGPITDLKQLCSNVLKIPNIFSTMLATRIQLTHASAYTADKLSKAGFAQFWQDTNSQSQDPRRRLFNLLAQPK